MSDYQLLIDGKLVAGDQTMPVLNPATEEVVAQCPRASKNQLDQAVAAAKAAFPAWAATPMEERRKLVNKMADVIEANAGELARTLTGEQGKPLADATGEVMGMAAFFRYLSSLELPMRVIENSGDRKVEAYRRPLGVIGAIIPWNYPLLILSFKLPSALLAGNTIVVKPAPTTPLSTLKFAELVKDVLPKGVLNVITDANDLGDLMTKHPDIRKISFTGSTATGQKVMASAAATLKRRLKVSMNSFSTRLAAAWVRARASRSSETSRSCKVRHSRSTRPLACGVSAVITSMFSASKARPT